LLLEDVSKDFRGQLDRNKATAIHESVLQLDIGARWLCIVATLLVPLDTAASARYWMG